MIAIFLRQIFAMMVPHVLPKVIDGVYSLLKSAGWRITEEDFWKQSCLAETIDNLKLRVSYGVLGNQNIGLYPYQQTYSLGYNYPIGNPRRPAVGCLYGKL